MAQGAIVRAFGLLALGLAGTAHANGNQGNPATGGVTPGNTQSRGVMILRPAETTPTPAPQPSPNQDAPPPVRPVATVTALPAPPPIVHACSRPFAHPDLTLSDSRAFKSALRSRLARKDGPVVVDIRHPFPISGATPPALIPWLSEVKANGGLVSVDQYCQQSRGFFSFLRGLLGNGEDATYKAADGYDAVFHVDGLAGAVTQVEFRPRAAQ